MLTAAMATAVYGLFRAGEITIKGDKHHMLTRGDVIWHPASADIRLRQSKTDYLRKGVTVHLFRNNSPTCPFPLLKVAWDAATDRLPSAALFQDGEGSPLRYTELLAAVKRAAAACKIHVGYVGTHSLRMGGATSLAIVGTPEYLIKIMGRFRSLSYQKYIRLNSDQLRRASFSMASQARLADPFGGISLDSAARLGIDDLDITFRAS